MHVLSVSPNIDNLLFYLGFLFLSYFHAVSKNGILSAKVMLDFYIFSGRLFSCLANFEYTFFSSTTKF